MQIYILGRGGRGEGGAEGGWKEEYLVKEWGGGQGCYIQVSIDDADIIHQINILVH